MRSLLVTMLAVQLALAGLGAQSATTAKPTPPPPNPTGVGVKAFQDRINEWMAFHNKVDNGVPRLTETADPKQIAERERALGEALIKARPNPVMGEYFPRSFGPF